MSVLLPSIPDPPFNAMPQPIKTLVLLPYEDTALCFYCNGKGLTGCRKYKLQQNDNLDGRNRQEKPFLWLLLIT